MPEIPEGAVVITTGQMYQQLVDLTAAVAKLDGRLDKLDKVDDHEVRIRSLERWKYGLAAAVLAGGGGSVAAWTQAVGH